MNNLSVQQLRRVLEIKEKIEQLNDELDQVLSGSGSSSGSAAATSGQQKRRGRPPGAGAAKVAAAPSASSAGRKKGGRGPMSDEARARIAEAARLRWAKAKKSGKNRL